MNSASRSDLERVRSYIASGPLSDDGRLPPERELAPMLGLTRNQIRSAFKKLEKEGVIWRHVGKGTFVGARPEPATAAAQMPASVADLSNPREVIEARVLVEPILARLAALRATPRDIEAMGQLLDKASLERDPFKFQVIDRAWHLQLARASGNHLLANFLDMVQHQTDPNIWSRLTDLYMTNERMNEAVGEHRLVYEAIKARDPATAEDLMRAHIRSVRSYVSGDID